MKAKHAEIQEAWQSACAYEDIPDSLDLENAEMLCSENIETLAQAQHKKQTFCDTYCDGRGGERGAAESVWDLVTLPAPLEAIAIIVCVPALAQRFFSPKTVAAQPPAKNGMVRASTEHRAIGALATATQSATALKEFMMETMLAGVRLGLLFVLQRSYARLTRDTFVARSRHRE